MIRRRRPLATRVALLALLLVAAAAGARKAKVYKYETRDGKVDYGTEVPEGAVVLAEVGETEVAGAEPLPSSLPSAEQAGARVGSAVEDAVTVLAAHPVVGAVFAVLTYLWAILVLRAFPPLFSTLDLDLRRCARLVTLVVACWTVLALAGRGLEWLWLSVGWSPRGDLGARTVDAIGWSTYAVATVVAFSQRLGVGFAQAALLAALWLAVVVGTAWLVCAYGVAYVI